MMYLKKFNALSPQDQKIIVDAAKEVVVDNVKDIESIETQAVATLKARKVNIAELTPAELAPFINATKAIEQKYAVQDPLIAEFVKAARSVK